MIKVKKEGHIFRKGEFLPSSSTEGYKKTISYSILSCHNKARTTGFNDFLRLRFDAIASHDITYVGIIQTARAIGLKEFSLPYILTNCHNSLCAVGGTINEDDHVYGLTAAKKYGGVYVPAHLAVIHTFIREELASPKKMILGSDSHTRYGPLGTMAMGEGGPELVKQLIGSTYDLKYPEIIAINLKGKPRKGVGPQDVALLMIGEVFKNGFTKNKVLEFVGEGVTNLPIEFRIGIDVMTTETACLSSIWITDAQTEAYLAKRGREKEYCKLYPEDGAYYDGVIEIDLSKVEPMIALPFHPSNTYKLSELIARPNEILGFCQEQGRKLLKNNNFDLISKIDKKGGIKIDQAIIAGCAGGTYDNIIEVSNILAGKNIGVDLPFSVYCGSQPIYMDLMKKGAIAKIISAGGIIKTSFCGPCFGAGDVPSNNALSIRHTTRNFESREGSKPSEGQIASVALMDARSIAATVANKGILTSAFDCEYEDKVPEFEYDKTIYQSKVYYGYKKPLPETEIIYGPNIVDWPPIPSLPDVLILRMDSIIDDVVTTTDELIPSGEASSYRSNPLRLAEFTLSRKDPGYVERVKQTMASKKALIDIIQKKYSLTIETSLDVGSVIYANKPGDGSAREQAASSQRVLGGAANIAKEYATKRYRSNLINWGILPILFSGGASEFAIGDIIVIFNPAKAINDGHTKAIVIKEKTEKCLEFSFGDMTEEEKQILKTGCLINYQKNQQNI